MFTYSDVDASCIISCDISNIKFIGEKNVTIENGGVTCNELFPIGSTWKSKTFLHNIVTVYAARTGWKCTKRNSTKILCSCFDSTTLKTKPSSGSIHKNCTWMITMKSTKYMTKVRSGAHLNGRTKRVPIFNDDTPVIISSPTCLEHGGTCTPSTQQQLVQRSRSGDYIKK